MANYPRFSQESRTMCSSRYLQPLSNLFPLASKMGRLPQTLKNKISEAAIPPHKHVWCFSALSTVPTTRQSRTQNKTIISKLCSYPLNVYNGIKKNQNCFVMRYCLFSRESYEPNIHQSQLNSCGLLYLKPLHLM